MRFEQTTSWLAADILIKGNFPPARIHVVEVSSRLGLSFRKLGKSEANRV